MASSSDIGIIVRSSGIMVGATRVDRTIDFCDLLRVLSDIVGLDLNIRSLKVSSVFRDSNEPSSIPIKNNSNLRSFFDPAAGFNSIELIVESEDKAPLQAPHIAWKNQHSQSVGSGHGCGIGTDVYPSGNTNYSARHNAGIVDLSGDHFGANNILDSEPCEDSFDGDDNAEERTPRVAPRPDSLSKPFFSLCRDVPSELIYNADHGVLSKGMIFRDKLHLQTVVKHYSVRYAKREYRIVGSSQSYWKIVCKKNPSNDMESSPTPQYCQWWLRARYAKKHHYWEISALGLPHSCNLDTASKSRKDVCDTLLATDLETKVQMELGYEVRFVMEHALKQYGYAISYKKAWQMLKGARDNVFGTWENSCQYLPKFMAALQKCNPGTVVEWRHKDDNDGVEHTLGYVFWAFRPCIEAFRHCRKILTVGCTDLDSKYKHKLLIANIVDADFKIIPLAYAIVDEENFQSWHWFLQMLATHVVRDMEGICLISSRHEDILKAVDNVSAFHPPSGMHCYCLRSVASDINTQFKSVRLRDLCYKAGKSSAVEDFESTMNEIKSLNQEAYEYLAAMDPSKWTWCHHRFGVMTTNISEAMNGILKGVRCLPIAALVSETFSRSKTAFVKRKEAALKLQMKNQSWTDHIQHQFDKEQRLGKKHRVDLHNFSRQTATVTACVEESRDHCSYIVSLTGPECSCGQWKVESVPCSHAMEVCRETATVTTCVEEEESRDHCSYTVSLTGQECSCGQWKLDSVPCSHAMEVCRQFAVDPAMHVPHCYSTDAYLATYSSSGGFVPLPREEKWDEPLFRLKHDPDRRTRHRDWDVTSDHDEMNVPQTRSRQRQRRSEESVRASHQ